MFEREFLLDESELDGEFWNTARSMSVKWCSTMAPQTSSRKYTKRSAFAPMILEWAWSSVRYGAARR